MPESLIPTPRGPVPGYLAVPAGAGPWPGVVVIHEMFGLDDDIRRHADRLAQWGYLTLAPDFFAWGRWFACLRAAFRELRGGEGRMFDDIDAARGWLADRDDCTGRVGVLGFCMGGGFALLAAPRSPFAAASVNYGQVPADAERVLAGACPLVGSYGGRDRGLRGAAARLEGALEQLGIAHDIKEYPEAGHSFMNRHHGPAFAALGAVLGAGFDGPAAGDAWGRIMAFFDAHLRQE